MMIHPRMRNVPMSNDAYAGFLRLLLTPDNEVPRESAELDAYLLWSSHREPLSDEVRRVLGQTTVEAA